MTPMTSTVSLPTRQGLAESGGKRPDRSLLRSPRAARRAWTARGIKRWPGLLLDDAIGKTGSGCFPDLPATGYYQTLRVSERSPQKTVSGAVALRHSALKPHAICATSSCNLINLLLLPGSVTGAAVRFRQCRASDSGCIVNGNRSHFKEFFCPHWIECFYAAISVHQQLVRPAGQGQIFPSCQPAQIAPRKSVQYGSRS